LFLPVCARICSPPRLLDLRPESTASSQREHTSIDTRTEWGEFRLSIRKRTSLEGLLSASEQLMTRVHIGCLNTEWVKSRREAWKSELSTATDLKELGNLIKELDADGINWDKHALLHTVLDAVDMIPFSQVQDQSTETWEYTIPKKLQEAATAASFVAVIVEIDDMIKDSSRMRDPNWMGSKGRRTRWANACKDAASWDKAAALFKTWEEHAVDWREAKIAMQQEHKREQGQATTVGGAGDKKESGAKRGGKRSADDSVGAGSSPGAAASDEAAVRGGGGGKAAKRSAGAAATDARRGDEGAGGGARHRHQSAGEEGAGEEGEGGSGRRRRSASAQAVRSSSPIKNPY
jgi:hypothetical protein